MKKRKIVIVIGKAALWPGGRALDSKSSLDFYPHTGRCVVSLSKTIIPQSSG